MTQMLLFEPQTATLDHPPAVRRPPKRSPQQPTANTARSKRALVCKQRETPKQTEKKAALHEQKPVEGVQRMGDLARAVLLRYELAARHREEVAKRKQRFANSAK